MMKKAVFLALFAIFSSTFFLALAFAQAGAPTQDDDEKLRPLQVGINSSCDGNVVTVLDEEGKPLADAEVDVFIEKNLSFLLNNGITDKGGKVSFNGCGSAVKIRVKRSSYESETQLADLIDCSACIPGCQANADCQDGEVCLGGLGPGNYEVVTNVTNDDGEWALTHEDLNLSYPNGYSLKFEIKLVADKPLSQSRGPYYNNNSYDNRSSCIIYVPYIEVTTDGSPFEAARSDAPGMLSDDEFLIAINKAECDDDDDGLAAGDLRLPPGSVFMKVSPDSDDYGVTEYSPPGIEMDYLGAQEVADVLIQRTADISSGDGMLGSLFDGAGTGYLGGNYVFGVKDSAGTSYIMLGNVFSYNPNDLTFDFDLPQNTSITSRVCRGISPEHCCGVIGNHDCGEFECGTSPSCPACASGECKNNQCEAILQIPPIIPRAECQDDSDCPPGESCQDDKCVMLQVGISEPEETVKPQPGFFDGIMDFFANLFKGIFGG